MGYLIGYFAGLGAGIIIAILNDVFPWDLIPLIAWIFTCAIINGYYENKKKG